MEKTNIIRGEGPGSVTGLLGGAPLLKVFFEGQSSEDIRAFPRSNLCESNISFPWVTCPNANGPSSLHYRPVRRLKNRQGHVSTPHRRGEHFLPPTYTLFAPAVAGNLAKLIGGWVSSGRFRGKPRFQFFSTGPQGKRFFFRRPTPDFLQPRLNEMPPHPAGFGLFSFSIPGLVKELPKSNHVPREPTGKSGFSKT